MVRRTETTAVADIERQYVLHDAQTVRKYLRSHPFLVPLLQEAYGEIERCFGNNLSVVLEVVVDPEIPNYRKLWVLMQIGREPGAARAKLDCLDDQWWLPQSHRANGSMNIGLEFV